MNSKLKFGENGLLKDLQLLCKGILKIFIFMWCRSPQREFLFAFFFKGMKHYFGKFFGQISLPKNLFKWKIFRLQIKMSKVVFSSLEFWT